MYVSIAYRWGESNNHHYILGAGDDLPRLQEQAENEVQNRGGKYSVVIYKVDPPNDEGEQHYDQVAFYEPPYLPTYGEPHIDHKREAAESLGYRVMEAYADGKAWLPNPDPNSDPNTLTRLDVALPEWLADEAKRKLEFAEASAEADRELRAERETLK